MITAEGTTLTETTTRAVQEATRARRIQLKRRAKRGIVASYIHEISARHRNEGAPRVDKPVQPTPEPAAGT
jgi:hypothetical protein